jgi:hypothetical protein
MESLGYVLLYFLHRQLPWNGLKAETKKEKYQLIMEKKKSISVEELCGDGPREFALYFEHIRGLKYRDKPKYTYLRKIFRTLFIKKGFQYDHVYDWTILKYLELQAQIGKGSLQLNKAIAYSSEDGSMSGMSKSSPNEGEAAASGSESSDKDTEKSSNSGTPPAKEAKARLKSSEPAPKSSVVVVIPSTKTRKRARNSLEGKVVKKALRAKRQKAKRR